MIWPPAANGTALFQPTEPASQKGMSCFAWLMVWLEDHNQAVHALRARHLIHILHRLSLFLAICFPSVPPAVYLQGKAMADPRTIVYFGICLIAAWLFQGRVCLFPPSPSLPPPSPFAFVFSLPYPHSLSLFSRCWIHKYWLNRKLCKYCLRCFRDFIRRSVMQNFIVSLRKHLTALKDFSFHSPLEMFRQRSSHTLQLVEKKK